MGCNCGKKKEDFQQKLQTQQAVTPATPSLPPKPDVPQLPPNLTPRQQRAWYREQRAIARAKRAEKKLLLKQRHELALKRFQESQQKPQNPV